VFRLCKGDWVMSSYTKDFVRFEPQRGEQLLENRCNYYTCSMIDGAEEEESLT